MTITRGLFLTLGLAAGAVGALELLARGSHNLISATTWLVGGVLLHDFVFAPLVVMLLLAGMTVLPSWARPAAAAASVVLVTVTLLAVPVLGRFGARPDNPTLLDRPYAAGWLVFAGLVLGCACGWAFVQRRGEGRQ
ncbi:MAG TPA: hypothetical protein VK204_13595 [Nocardioidaceae bacterium]|nr:hypothetical protein [Nocardioidaceae bacterium]